MKKYVEFFLVFLIALDLVALMIKLTHLFSTGGAYERSAAALRANELVEVHRLQQRAVVLTRRITLEAQAEQEADEHRIRGRAPARPRSHRMNGRRTNARAARRCSADRRLPSRSATDLGARLRRGRPV